MSSLGAVVWCVSQEGSRGLEQLRKGQEQHQGMRSSGLGDGAVVTHPFPQGATELWDVQAGLQPGPSHSAAASEVEGLA